MNEPRIVNKLPFFPCFKLNMHESMDFLMKQAKRPKRVCDAKYPPRMVNNVAVDLSSDPGFTHKTVNPFNL